MLLGQSDKAGMSDSYGIEDEKAASKAAENTATQAESNTKQGVFAYFNRKKNYTLKEITVSKTLLEHHSTYWARILKDNENMTTPLGVVIIPGVISPEGISRLIHYWYREEVCWYYCQTNNIKSNLSDLIELSRLLEHWKIKDLKMVGNF